MAMDVNTNRALARGLGHLVLSVVGLLSLCGVTCGQVTGWGLDSSGSISGPSGQTNAKQVAVGGHATIVLYTNGTLAAYGLDNGFGIVTQVPTGSDYTQISCSTFTGLALKDNGTVVAWGNNGNGQASVPTGLTNVIDVVAGQNFSMALKDDGTVVAWGDNTFGEATIPNGLSSVIAISAEGDTALALKSDGTVVAWGNDDNGQADVPSGLTGVVAVAAAQDASLALLSNGTLVAWGDNTFGETIIPTGLSSVVSIFANANSMFGALKSDGTVVEWGENAQGQATVPGNLYGVTSVSAGYFETIAIVGDQSAVAWGSNASGQASIPALNSVKSVAEGNGFTIELLSNGTVAAQGSDASGETSVPAGLSGVSAIAAGASHCLALLDNGTVVGWGDNSFGETTIPSGLTGVKAISAGSQYSAALLDDGTLVEWGIGFLGQTTIPNGLAGVKSISAGMDFMLALKDDGSVVAWGNSNEGQTTVAAGAESTIAAISAGAVHGLALSSGGTVVSWGGNSGNRVPNGIKGVVQVGAGEQSSQVLLSNGTLTNWGDNGAGERNTPTGFSGCTMVATNWETTVVLAPPAVTSVSLSPSTLVGGNSTICTVTISPAAGPSGATVTISGTGPVTLPASITISAGANQGTFQLSTSPTLSSSSENIVATYGSTTAITNLNIGNIYVDGVSFNPASVEGGTSATGTVDVSTDPGPVGITVTLAGSGPFTVPTSVFIPGGSTSATFTVPTTSVSSAATEWVTAGVPGLADQQDVTCQLSSGTFTLTFSGQTTAPIAYNASATDVQAALQSLSTIGAGNVTCTSGPLSSAPVVCTFSGTLAGAPQPLLISSSSSVAVQDTSYQGSTFTATAANVISLSSTASSVVGGSDATFIVTLDTPAGASGDLVSLSGSGPVSLPSSVLVPAGSNTMTFTAPTSTVSANTNEQVTATLGSSSQNTTVSVLPATVASVILATQSVTGGSNIQASVTLDGPAPSGGLAVSVTTNSSAVQPTTVTVPAGMTTYNFALKTSAVSSKVWVRITVGGMYAFIYVVPATISNLTAPPSVQAGVLAEIQVILNGPAGPSGDVVSLSSNSVAVTVPTSVTVPAGAKSMWIGLKTSVVGSSTPVTVTGTTGTVSQTATFSVMPSGLQGISVTPNSVIAGAVVQAKVTLVHPTSNVATVNLSSNNAAAPVPATASIGPGDTSYSFLIRTRGVSSSTQATI